MEVTVSFYGQIAGTPKIRYVESDLPRTELQVSVDRLADPDEVAEGCPPLRREVLHVVVVGEAAEPAALSLDAGCLVVGRGRLRTREVVDVVDGGVHSRLEVVTTQIGVVPATTAPRTSPTPPASRVRVTIMGPNLPDGLMHVHRTDCADLRRNHDYAGLPTTWSIEVSSVREVVESIYGDMLAEHPDAHWSDYRQDVKIFECAAGLLE